jgi:hypothetical protein
MYNRMRLLLAFALLLSFAHISALSLPLFFSLNSEIHSLTSALETDSADQLFNLLRHHSLQQICHHDLQPRTNSTSMAVTSPFFGLGEDSRDLLELSLPSIFRDMTIDGDWRNAAKRIHALENCPAVGRFARSAGLAHGNSGSVLMLLQKSEGRYFCRLQRPTPST